MQPLGEEHLLRPAQCGKLFSRESDADEIRIVTGGFHLRCNPDSDSAPKPYVCTEGIEQCIGGLEGANVKAAEGPFIALDETCSQLVLDKGGDYVGDMNSFYMSSVEFQIPNCSPYSSVRYRLARHASSGDKEHWIEYKVKDEHKGLHFKAGAKGNFAEDGHLKAKSPARGISYDTMTVDLVKGSSNNVPRKGYVGLLITELKICKVNLTGKIV